MQQSLFRIFVPLKCRIINFKIDKDKWLRWKKLEAKQDCWYSLWGWHCSLLSSVTFLNSGSTYFRQSQEKVAEVDGEVIKIQEFQDRVDEMTEMYKMQTGSTSLPEEYQTQIRQSVFDGMVQDVVFE